MNRRNPYKLFDYYQETDAEVFFGRETEVSAVVGDILANKLLVLFARSGSGKTSLLNAGIGPALREIGKIDESDPGIQMVTIRLSADRTPAQSAVQALQSQYPALALDITSLHEALQQVCGGAGKGGVVLIFDQFEELFISLFRDRPAERLQFAEQLAEIIEDGELRAYIVLSLRSDQFHYLNEFRGYIPDIFQNNTNLELKPFDRDTALRVVRGPAELRGVVWENGLPEQIVAELATLNEDRDGILPIHIQIICHGLWESLTDKEREITRRHYQAFLPSPKPNGLSAAEAMIQRRIIAPLEVFKDQQRRLLVRLLRELMTKHHTKAVRSSEELARLMPARWWWGIGKRSFLERGSQAELGNQHKPSKKPLAQRERGWGDGLNATGFIPPKPVQTLLTYLEQQLLLRVERSGQQRWYELRHDYLAVALLPWLDQQEKDFKDRDLRKRISTAVVLVIITALASKLWLDWHSYEAEIGAKVAEDELIVHRHPAFGVYQPDFWKLEVKTGYLRPQLQAGKVPHFHFDVPDALVNWAEIEPHLDETTRQVLQMASRVNELKPPAANQTKQDGDKSQWLLFDVEKHNDIALYAAADPRILAYLEAKLPFANTGAKSDILSALARVTWLLQPAQASRLVGVLLKALQDSDAKTRKAAADALSRVSHKLSPAEAQAVADTLRIAIKDADADVRQAAALALGAMAKTLPPAGAQAVADALRLALKDADAYVRYNAASALGAVAKTLPPAGAQAVADALLLALKDADTGVRGASAKALGAVAKNLPPAGGQAMADALRRDLKDADTRVRQAAAWALGAISETLPPAEAQAVADVLRIALKDADGYVRQAAVSALGAVAKTLPPAGAQAVADALRPVLKDGEYEVSAATAVSLGAMAELLDAKAAKEVIGKAYKLHIKEWYSKQYESSQVLQAMIRLALYSREPDIAGSMFLVNDTPITGYYFLYFPTATHRLSNSQSQRELAQANWPQSTPELLTWLEDHDSAKRIFAAHVLAQRPLDAAQRERIQMLRDDPAGRPWVKMAALRCLVEIQREKRAVLQDREMQGAGREDEESD